MTELVRALGFGSDDEIIKMYGDNDSLCQPGKGCSLKTAKIHVLKKP